MKKLPLKFRILHLLFEKEGLTASETMKILREEYSMDRQFKYSVINNHFQSLKAVGIVETTNVIIDSEGKLHENFKITDYGITRHKYLPKKWRNQ